MNAFLTGSRAYGTPREDSDVDLVLLVSAEDMQDLIDLADESDGSDEYSDSSGESLRFGKLNLLCFTDPEFFGAWRDATAELVTRQPVTRDEAVKAIEAKVLVVLNTRWEAEAKAPEECDAIGPGERYDLYPEVSAGTVEAAKS